MTVSLIFIAYVTGDAMNKPYIIIRLMKQRIVDFGLMLDPISTWNMKGAFLR